MIGGFASEVQLARHVVAYWRSFGWKVYQEVRGPGAGGGGTCDVVVRADRLLVACEAKLFFGLDVLGQVLAWRGCAHVLYVAVPDGIGGRAGRLALEVARWKGVGVLDVSPGGSVLERVRPAILRRPPAVDRWKLHEEQETFAEAGNAGGQAWSPWRRTQAEVLRLVKEAPGIRTRELVEKVRHHYGANRAAEAALPRWIGTSLLPGIVGRVELRVCEGGRRRRVLCWYPAGAAP